MAIIEFRRPISDDDTWQICRAPLISRTTVDGTKTRLFAETWRRRTASGWEYRQALETYDHPISQQWWM